MSEHRHWTKAGIWTALALGWAFGAASAAAQVQNKGAQTRSGQSGVFLNLPEPYAGLDCGTAYRPDWNLSLDQIVAYAESQLSACDLAVTVSTIEGDVSRAYAKIGLANSQNWIAWSAAAAFLPGSNDPAADDQTAQVRAAQSRIQNARDGLRFLAKLTAVMQHPEALAAEPAFDTVPNQAPLDLPRDDNGTAIQQTPLSAPPTAQSPLVGAPATPFGQQVQTPGGAPNDTVGVQVACVTSTAWVLEPRPAQTRGRMTIDDPVAGQALAWLSGYALGAAAGPRIRAFAACPGATPAFAPSTYAPLPGAAQGLTPAPSPAAPDTATRPDTSPPADAPTVPPSPVPSQAVPSALQQD